MSDNSVEKRGLRYIKALIFLSDRTGYKLCQYIQQNLKLKVKLYDCIEKDIMEVLYDNEHGTFNEFIKKYMVEIKRSMQLQEINDFKIYIVMDLDKFSNDEEVKMFLDKSMFKEYWAYDYIVPIYSETNLKEIILESSIHSEIKFKENKEYIKVFPFANKFDLNVSDREEVELLKNLIQKNRKTNLNNLLDYCLNL